MNRLTLISISLLLNFCISYAQNQSNSNIEKVNTLFEKYNTSKSPGYALGIIKNGKLIHSKGFGMANLDYNIPITDSTAFYIGSMAKQFTTTALLILEAEGKIDLNAPVKTYLSDFPEYESPITINHLIHHTSGIRETNSLQLFQGIDKKFEEVFNTDDLYKLVISQKQLNFKTGSEYRYSSGGYAVLAKIVETISETSLRNFLEERVFKPLEMQATFVCDNHNEIVKNRAVSYWPIGNDKFERRNQIFDAYGDGGIITTVKDLAKWDKAFYEDKLGVNDFSKKMYQKGALNNNNEIEYARALQVRNYKGLQMITHNGGMLGFRVDMVRFPETNHTFILLGNSAYLDPTGDILKIADIYLEQYIKNEENIETTYQTDEEIKISQDILKRYEGYYWTDDTNYFRRITARNDSLFLDSGNIKYAQYLKPINKNEFSIDGFYLPNKLTFSPTKLGKELSATFGDSRRTFRKFNPQIPKQINDIVNYTGKYYSNELSTTYHIFIKDEKMLFQINNKKPTQIFPVLQNSRVVWNGKKMFWLGFGEVKFQFNDKNKVTGLAIGDNRVSGVLFKKTTNE